MATQKKQKQTKSKSISEAKGQNTEGIGPLIEALVTDLASHDDRMREKARHTFVAMGKDAVQSLIEALKYKRYFMRWEAAKALGKIANADASPALVEALEDEVFDVRWLAAIALIGMMENS